jgi:hypothetical protein
MRRPFEPLRNAPQSPPQHNRCIGQGSSPRRSRARPCAVVVSESTPLPPPSSPWKATLQSKGREEEDAGEATRAASSFSSSVASRGRASPRIAAASASPISETVGGRGDDCWAGPPLSPRSSRRRWKCSRRGRVQAQSGPAAAVFATRSDEAARLGGSSRGRRPR